MAPPPFPAAAVITLSLCFLVNIYTVTSIFPYLAYYVVETGAASDVDAAGYWSGAITAAFMCGRVFSGYPLGRVADRVGRKPVLIGGLVSVGVLAVAFGATRSVGAAIATRFLTGLLNGIPIVARTAATEIVDVVGYLEPEDRARYRSRAVAWVLGSYSIGVVTGPAIGGLLAGSSALRDASPLFRRYPYLAPNLVTCFLAAVLVPCVSIFVPETRAPRRPDAPPRKAASILKNDGAVGCVCTYATYSAVEIGLTEVVCLWAVASRDAGGLGVSVQEIGQALGAIGVLMAGVQFLGYERLAREFGERECVVGALAGAWPAIALLPGAAALLAAAAGPKAPLAAIVVVHGFIKCADAVFFTALTPLANATVATVDRGAFQGVNVTLGSLGKALGPAAGAVLFAWTINARALDGVAPRSRSALVFFAYAAGAFRVSRYASRRLPRAAAPAAPPAPPLAEYAMVDTAAARAAENPLRAPAAPPTAADDPLIVEVGDAPPRDAGADSDEYTDDEDSGIDADEIYL